MSHWMEDLPWADPVTGEKLIADARSRDPTGRPYTGVLRRKSSDVGYPIIDGIPRMTPDLAREYNEWLSEIGVLPPSDTDTDIQSLNSVESFGFQWSWDDEPRPEGELDWITTERFGVEASDYEGKRVFDAGCGAGAQSRRILEYGADRVISMDLSRAIDVAAEKLSDRDSWLGIQGDLTALPFDGPICDFVYCEGVIHHTQDSERTIGKLLDVLEPGGMMAASHYVVKDGLKYSLYYKKYVPAARKRLSNMSRDKLLFVTGIISALSMIPLIGPPIGRVLGYKNPRMPGFKHTWTNTYDFYGQHPHQRYATPDEFHDMFSKYDVSIKYAEPSRVLVNKGN